MNAIDHEGMSGVTARRLESDAEELRGAAERTDGRMEVQVHRRAGRIMEIDVLLHDVRTSFKDRRTGEIVFLRRLVVINFNPHLNAEGGIGYPFSRPGVRIIFPGLENFFVPFSAGLFWIEADRFVRELAAQMGLADADQILAGLESGAGGSFGTPCLWRGNYKISYTAFFCVKNAYRLLVDGRFYSVRDCLNPESALFFADRQDLFPLDRDHPIPGLLDESEPSPPKALAPAGFKLEVL